jgi:hypothetical protein
MLTIWTSLVDGDNGLLVCGVDGLEHLSILALHPFSIDVETDGLLIGDAGGLDLLCERHDCGLRVSQLLFEVVGIWVSNGHSSSECGLRKEREGASEVYEKDYSLICNNSDAGKRQ